MVVPTLVILLSSLSILFRLPLKGFKSVAMYVGTTIQTTEGINT